MAVPTDLRDRARHPEDYARPDEPGLKRTWTGIGAPANSYDWDKNPVHGAQSDPGKPVGRPGEVLPRAREATEWVPPRQPQRDPWSLTGPQRIETEITEPSKPIEPAPVSKVLITEKPVPQKQRDPWSFGKPIVVVHEDPEVHKPSAPDPVSTLPIVEFVPEAGRLKDPWEHSKPHRAEEHNSGSTPVDVPKTT